MRIDVVTKIYCFFHARKNKEINVQILLFLLFIFTLEFRIVNKFVHAFLCNSDRWIFLSFPLNFDHFKKSVVDVVIDRPRSYLQEYCSIFDREKHLINMI